MLAFANRREERGERTEEKRVEREERDKKQEREEKEIELGLVERKLQASSKRNYNDLRILEEK